MSVLPFYLTLHKTLMCNDVIFYKFCFFTGEDLSKEEHLDNEFLWNLKLLSEVNFSWGSMSKYLKLSQFSPCDTLA